MNLFIAGTDTGVGKTFITAALCSDLITLGLKVGIQKWVTTGCSSGSGDIQFIKSFVAKVHGKETARKLPASSPYCLSFPASPHLASALDEVEIDADKILHEYKKMALMCQILLVEGTGGIMVPVTRSLLFSDILQRAMPLVILVARSGLGTINHTLLTIEALRTRGLDILCVILNSVSPGEGKDHTSPVIVEDNIKIISELGRVDVFGPVPFARDFDQKEVWKQIRPVAEMIKIRFQNK